ncbi:hypothetical protein MVES_003205 [Malassezia vespertilionis]|uniref:Dynein light intermediate chain n=1 Tax=Malassezia vespertilionis TaxID=2020962 RepID=A0A2N1J8X0_9BASI|nr:hypothetical protein MVES_003205 [Malassezia vespertilionis]
MPDAAALWANLLESARAQDAAPRTVVPGTGKSTLLHGLCGAESNASVLSYVHTSLDKEQLHNVGIYTLHSSDDAVLSTLPYAFPPVERGDAPSASLERMRNAVFLLVLDTSAPWSVLAQLKVWLASIRSLVDTAHADDAPSVRADMRTQSPLTDGMLTTNLGVRLVLVLTKTDAAAALVKENRVREEQLEYMVQVLRTVALAYGAGVLGTSQAHPASMDTLRSYLDHLLFSVALPWDEHASSADLAGLCIPAGWDSWSKIQVLDESFQCDAYAHAWAEAMEGRGTLLDAHADKMPPPPTSAAHMHSEVPMPDTQAFLAQLRAQQSSSEAAASLQSTLDMPAVGAAIAAQQDMRLETPRKPRRSMHNDVLHAARDTPNATTPKQTEVLHSFFQSRTSQ